MKAKESEIFLSLFLSFILYPFAFQSGEDDGIRTRNLQLEGLAA
jgi:hypothetical protein